MLRGCGIGMRDGGRGMRREDGCNSQKRKKKENRYTLVTISIYETI